MEYITDIFGQTVTINGTTYPATDATASHDGPSRLQTIFRQTYGTDSFQAGLADFLAEWFDGTETLKVHTSGSTGTPKELHVEKRLMMNSAMMTVSFLGLKPHDTALLCMPLQYIAGKMVVVRSLVAGLNLLPVTPCGHPLENLPAPPAFAAMIPMQVYNSLHVTEENRLMRQISHLIIGGGAVDEAMQTALADFPNAVWSTYGMTETLSHIALRRLNGPDASQWYTPFSHVHLSLSDTGTLVIHAPSVSKEILTTNDIAELDAEGRFRILGRADNTINTGGVKVQIEQVEDTLRKSLRCPFMITSVPDPKFGERIVMLTEGHISAETIAHAIDTLPAYWRPKQVFSTERLPLTGTGKPDRANARRIAEEKTAAQ